MPLTTNSELNGQQVAACLAILNNSGNLLVQLEEAKDTTDTSPNGDARLSLENTLTAACDRLEEMLKDTRRWSLPAADGHAHYEAVALEQTEQLSIANALKRHELFVANFNRQIALQQFREVMANPVATPKPPAKNARKKK